MRITDYKEGDEKQIVQLFEKTFGKPISENFWKWRFLDNPANKIMIKLMWDGNILVGHYAVSPVELECNKETILTALSMTTMTHPEYMGKGIFSLLAEELYQSEQEKSRLKAVWGYPNNNSHYAFLKNVKWSNLETIPTFSLPAEKIKEGGNTKIRETKEFSDNHILAAKTVSAPYRIKIKRSVEYLNWRYIQHPENQYHIFEYEENDLSYYVVTKVFPSFDITGKHEIDLLEFIVPNDHTIISDFLYAIKMFYNDYDLLKINLWLPLNDSKHITLEKLGFTNIAPVTYFGIRTFDPMNGLLLLENKNWDYCMGYSDIY